MQIQKGRYYRNHWLQHVGNIIGERVTAKFIRALLTSRTDERSQRLGPPRLPGPLCCAGIRKTAGGPLSLVWRRRFGPRRSQRQKSSFARGVSRLPPNDHRQCDHECDKIEKSAG
jgi:hypothetical protein